MKISYLFADRPIRKSYELAADGSLKKTPYPFVYDVTSHEYEPKNLPDFAAFIQQVGDMGGCLVKGELQRELKQESRAGSTNPNLHTQWVCLDLDSISEYVDVDAFLADIGLGDVDYVLQWSSSMGIESKAGFRCHIFMLLSQPAHPELLKRWLMHLNISTPAIAAQLQLTKTYNAIRWPLDITTCQNDKLIYVSPPLCKPPIKDPFEQDQVPRVSFVKRAKRAISLPKDIPERSALRTKVQDLVQKLREAQGLPKHDKRKTKMLYKGSVEYLANPDTATITETRTERGFVYFNLNGGDSWAYYHPVDNPNFIYNFKGEPVYRTEELLPEYWASLQNQKREALSSCIPDEEGNVYLAFRDFNSGRYINGIYNVTDDELTYAEAKNLRQLQDFLKQHGQPVPEVVPDWNIVWDPHTNVVVDPDARRLNTYVPSPFFSRPKPAQTPWPTMFPTINRVIDHVLGHSTETKQRFINWLAAVVQQRRAVGSAWVLHGGQGTGKGVLFHYIITPMLGADNVTTKRMEELESEFTGFLENKFIVFIDELEAGKSLYKDKLAAKLKNLIVEPNISIRHMYRSAYVTRNYTNLIFASNSSQPVYIDPDDRRMNVGVFQQVPIKLTSNDIDVLIPNELPVFYDYLQMYQVNNDWLRAPLRDDAKQQLIETSMNSIERLAKAINEGDLEFLWDQLPSSPKHVQPQHMLKYGNFRELLIEIANGPSAHKALSREDLFTIFQYCVGGMPESPHKFSALLKHHRIVVKPVYHNGRTIRGFAVTWQHTQAWHTQAINDIQKGLV